MKKVIRGAAAGLSVAGLSGLLLRFNGLNRTSMLVMLYLYVALGVAMSLDFEKPDLLHRIVVVSEGEAVKMRKLFTGEKYKIKGEVEKLT